RLGGGGAGAPPPAAPACPRSVVPAADRVPAVRTGRAGRPGRRGRGTAPGERPPDPDGDLLGRGERGGCRPPVPGVPGPARPRARAGAVRVHVRTGPRVARRVAVPG